jgi:hypothetical protein
MKKLAHLKENATVTELVAKAFRHSFVLGAVKGMMIKCRW